MTEETQVETPEVDFEEEQEVGTVAEQRTVPLQALESERRKRQDLEAQNKALQEMMLKSSNTSAPVEEEDDDEEFITKAELKKRLKEATFGNKREVMEEAFCSANPQAVELINKNLEAIIKRKPWLAQTIESAPNRYARAYEIVQDYAPREEVAPAKKFSDPKADAKRIVENSQKPGNPSTIAKPANMSNADYLRSIGGKAEFREYRKKVMSGG